MTGRVVVVAGTGTGVGKTVVTAALAARFRASGASVAAVKPAQTGVGPGEPGDLDVVRGLGGADHVLEPVRLPEPLAPDTAARRAGVALPPVAATAAAAFSRPRRVIRSRGSGPPSRTAAASRSPARRASTCRCEYTTGTVVDPSGAMQSVCAQPPGDA